MLAMMAALTGCASKAEIARLGERTWSLAPRGKEADAIYGDTVMRNDRLTAVIGNPVAGRHANMTVRHVGGAIIDLARRDRPIDQLSAYYPGVPDPGRVPLEFGTPLLLPARRIPNQPVVRGKSVTFSCPLKRTADEPAVEVRYVLEGGADSILVETVYSNPGEKPLTVDLIDAIRADRSFDKVPDGKTDLFWVYDSWFGQAYGLVCEGGAIEATSDSRRSTLKFLIDGKGSVDLAPGESFTLRRRIFPGRDLIQVKAIATRLSGGKTVTARIEVRGSERVPVAGARVELTRDGVLYGWGRTDDGGRLDMDLPSGRYIARATAVGRGSASVDLDTDSGRSQVVMMEPVSTVQTFIHDKRGGPIPCKVQFIGKDGTKNPDFGPDSGEHAVKNVYYSHTGSFLRPVPPGAYDVIISYGPEYDAIFKEVEIAPGTNTPIFATLVRSVDTRAWISADFHGHSSPSGDNTCSQLGRVLNLLCEHVEFAPCTEHNRLSSYGPHLERLGVEPLMATCVGVELTGAPGGVNHQNAFPLILTPRTQDQGAPLTDEDPEVQIERLALWDDGSEKLVQLNHPNVVQVFEDRDLDGTPDGGYPKMIPFVDVMEVHPPGHILRPPPAGENNRMGDWMRILAKGHRIPGVVNTDAHYAFHGSGGLRNYVRSPTDDPAKIRTMDVVRAVERGNVVMTNGPFVRVELLAAGSSGIPGTEVSVPDGRAELEVRVQCPNWIDVDRVQVFLNGTPRKKLNFTRLKHADKFFDGPMKFDQKIPLELKEDAFVIVVVAGEGSTLGPVAGPRRAGDMPVAVTNPIWVNVDEEVIKAEQEKKE